MVCKDNTSISKIKDNRSNIIAKAIKIKQGIEQSFVCVEKLKTASGIDRSKFNSPDIHGWNRLLKRKVYDASVPDQESSNMDKNHDIRMTNEEISPNNMEPNDRIKVKWVPPTYGNEDMNKKQRRRKFMDYVNNMDRGLATFMQTGMTNTSYLKREQLPTPLPVSCDELLKRKMNDLLVHIKEHGVPETWKPPKDWKDKKCTNFFVKKTKVSQEDALPSMPFIDDIPDDRKDESSTSEKSIATTKHDVCTKDTENFEDINKHAISSRIQDYDQDLMMSGFLDLSHERSNRTYEYKLDDISKNGKKVTSTPLVQNDGFNDHIHCYTLDSSMNNEISVNEEKQTKDKQNSIHQLNSPTKVNTAKRKLFCDEINPLKGYTIPKKQRKLPGTCESKRKDKNFNELLDKNNELSKHMVNISEYCDKATYEGDMDNSAPSSSDVPHSLSDSKNKFPRIEIESIQTCSRSDEHRLILQAHSPSKDDYLDIGTSQAKNGKLDDIEEHHSSITNKDDILDDFQFDNLQEDLITSIHSDIPIEELHESLSLDDWPNDTDSNSKLPPVDTSERVEEKIREQKSPNKVENSDIPTDKSKSELHDSVLESSENHSNNTCQDENSKNCHFYDIIPENSITSLQMDIPEAEFPENLLLSDWPNESNERSTCKPSEDEMIENCSERVEEKLIKQKSPNKVENLDLAADKSKNELHDSIPELFEYHSYSSCQDGNSKNCNSNEIIPENSFASLQMDIPEAEFPENISLSDWHNETNSKLKIPPTNKSDEKSNGKPSQDKTIEKELADSISKSSMVNETLLDFEVTDDAISLHAETEEFPDEELNLTITEEKTLNKEPIESKVCFYMESQDVSKQAEKCEQHLSRLPNINKTSDNKEQFHERQLLLKNLAVKTDDLWVDNVKIESKWYRGIRCKILNDLREKYSYRVDLKFPTWRDEKDLVTIVGTKESVILAKRDLLEEIKFLRDPNDHALPQDMERTLRELKKRKICYNVLKKGVCVPKNLEDGTLSSCTLNHVIAPQDFIDYYKLLSCSHSNNTSLPLEFGTRIEDIDLPFLLDLYDTHKDGLQDQESTERLEILYMILMDLNEHIDNGFNELIMLTMYTFWKDIRQNVMTSKKLHSDYRSGIVATEDEKKILSICSEITSVTNLVLTQNDEKMANKIINVGVKLLYSIYCYTLESGILLPQVTRIDMMNTMENFKQADFFTRMLVSFSFYPVFLQDDHLQIVSKAISWFLQEEMLMKSGIKELMSVLCKLDSTQLKIIGENLLSQLVDNCLDTEYEYETTAFIDHMILMQRDGMLPNRVLHPTSNPGGKILDLNIERKLLLSAKNQHWVEFVSLLNQNLHGEKLCIPTLDIILAKFFEGSVQAGVHVTNIAFQSLLTHYLMEKQNMLPIEHAVFSQLGGTFIVHLYDLCTHLTPHSPTIPDPLQVLECADQLKMKPWQFCTMYIPESAEHSNAIKVRIEPFKVLLTCISVWATSGKLEQLYKAYDLIHENSELLMKSDNIGLFFVAKRLFDSFISWLDDQSHETLSKSMTIYYKILFPFVEDQLNNGIEDFKVDVFEKYFNVLLHFALLCSKGTDTALVSNVLLPFIQKHQSKVIFEEGSIRGLVHLLRLVNHESVNRYYDIAVAHGVYQETCIDHFESCIQIVTNMTYQEMKTTLEQGLKAIADLITREEIIHLYQNSCLSVGEVIAHEVLKSIDNFAFAVELIIPATIPKLTNLQFIDYLSASTISDASKRLDMILEHEIKPRIFTKNTNSNKYSSKTRKTRMVLEPHSLINYLYKRVLNIEDKCSDIMSRVTFN